jgi:hypothetical protein
MGEGKSGWAIRRVWQQANKTRGGGAASSTMRKEPTDGGSGTSMGAATASRGEPEQEDWVDVKRRVVPEPR